MVSKKELLKYATNQALEKAKKGNLNALTKETLLAQAQNIIEDMFCAIGWTETGTALEKSTKPLMVWHHRTRDDQEADWRHLGFAKTELQNAAEDYLNTPWLHCKELDWLVLNTLTYADYQGTLDSVRSRTMPFSRYQSTKSGKVNFRILAELWRAALLVLKVAAWFTIFAAVSPASPYGPLIWIAITFGWLWRKWALRKKNKKILDSMFSTYTGFSTTDQNWKKVWEALEKSRALGAVWSSEVYQLVEKRMQANCPPRDLSQIAPQVGI